ncbi:hypothetical protein ACWGI0_23090 [Streptomyces sp. NPDC054802]
MDQGTAAVIAGGFGIVGTLGGALGGAWFASRATLRQVEVQEAVDVRHRLRDERRAAFSAVLDQCGVIEAAVNPVISTRLAPPSSPPELRRAAWDALNDALRALDRAVTAIEITGPDAVHRAAVAMHEAKYQGADSLRASTPFDVSSMQFAQTVREFEAARAEFIAAAREALQ